MSHPNANLYMLFLFVGIFHRVILKYVITNIPPFGCIDLHIFIQYNVRDVLGPLIHLFDGRVISRVY